MRQIEYKYTYEDKAGMRFSDRKSTKEEGDGKYADEVASVERRSPIFIMSDQNVGQVKVYERRRVNVRSGVPLRRDEVRPRDGCGEVQVGEHTKHGR
jgi:hypothetical protein